jgi:hypothetical protein
MPPQLDMNGSTTFSVTPTDRHRGVDGVAAGEEHADPGHRGQRTRGRHGTASAHDDRPVGVTMRRYGVLPYVPRGWSAAAPRRRGSSRSRTPSPRRFRPKMVSMIAAPG